MKIRTWKVYEVQNPGDLDQFGVQKRRAFIALGRGSNPYQTYGILTTTSYKTNEITNQLVIKDLLNNKKENKLLPNNLVRIFNSNLVAPYYQTIKGKKIFIDINAENRKKIIEHFNLQEYRTVREFKFHSLDQDEKIDYFYQANTLLKGINKNLDQAYDATGNLIDELANKHVSGEKGVVLDIETYAHLNKGYEDAQWLKTELSKAHQKINLLEKENEQLKYENDNLKNNQIKQKEEDYEMEI
ncbi:hypothetical protein [Spiroplasma chrysopicola]|uniref:Uncharacterized protein n=1 Tax=Spiroplasma chrysopicola DF-1 TaxID=1276227 RepID=R4U2B3_9MOLU|nr:hypothetical protein [Spiroplasma chrysopicola]AGM25497.1 hypothetical protein SCHRY_v1c09240 [Spiroplasma chrysopicola DF-1]